MNRYEPPENFLQLFHLSQKTEQIFNCLALIVWAVCHLVSRLLFSIYKYIFLR